MSLWDLGFVSAAEGRLTRAILTAHITNTKYSSAVSETLANKVVFVWVPCTFSTDGSISINRTNKLMSRLEDYFSKGTAMGEMMLYMLSLM